MKVLLALLLVVGAASTASAQIATPQPKQFAVKSATNEPLTFRIETRGSWVRVSQASGIVVRHEGESRIVDISAPATLDVGGDGDLELTLVAVGGGRVELSPVNHPDKDVLIRGSSISLKRTAGAQQISVIRSEEIVGRWKNGSF